MPDNILNSSFNPLCKVGQKGAVQAERHREVYQEQQEAQKPSKGQGAVLVTDKQREDEMEEFMKAGADMLTFPFLLAAMFLPKGEMDKILSKAKEKLKEEKEKPDEQTKNMSGFFFEE